MPRRIFKRYMPDQEKIREHKHLQFLGTLLHDPNILHLNRYSVSGAFALGLFWAFIPIPFQMVFAAIGSIWLRVNLPISVALVWITNPFTLAPIYYFCYKIGTWILGDPVRELEFQMTYEWVMQELGVIWLPLLVGCLLVSIISSFLGYFVIRGFWRLHVINAWKRRKHLRLKKIK